MLDSSGKKRSLTGNLSFEQNRCNLVPFLQSAELKDSQYPGFSCALIYKWVKPTSKRCLSLSDPSYNQCQFSCFSVPVIYMT